MKVRNIMFVFVLFGTLSIVAGACGNNAQAAGEQPQTAMASDHADHAEGEHAEMGFDSMPGPGTKAYCPVMEAEFEVKEDTQYSVYNGKTYVFCCSGCKPKFDENPEQFLNK